VLFPHVLQEDQTVIELVGRIGAKKWSQIAQQLPGRIGKQCRERWHNHLNPNINKAPWSEQEDRYGPIIIVVTCLGRHRCGHGLCRRPTCVFHWTGDLSSTFAVFRVP
jgi:hypothetical protein